MDSKTIQGKKVAGNKVITFCFRMQIKGKKRLLNPTSESPKQMGRPPAPIEERMRRAAVLKEMEEARRLKKEAKLLEMQEKAKNRRPIGRPPRKADDPVVPRRRANGTYFPPEFSGARQRVFDVEELPKKIERPPAVYSNQSPYDKYNL